MAAHAGCRAGRDAFSIDTLARAIPYECVAGWWDRALAHADEGCELGCDGNPVHLLAPVLVADRSLVEAHLGDEAAARRDADEAMLLETACGDNHGRADRGLGSRPPRALAPRAGSRASTTLVRLWFRDGPPASASPATCASSPTTIEALIGIGRFAEAEAVLEWFEGLAQRSGRIGALAACGRCRGLLHAARGDVEPAVTALEISRDRYAMVMEPFGLGRTLLELGSIERRRARGARPARALEASLGGVRGVSAPGSGWSEPGPSSYGSVVDAPSGRS